LQKGEKVFQKVKVVGKQVTKSRTYDVWLMRCVVCGETIEHAGSKVRLCKCQKEHAFCKVCGKKFYKKTKQNHQQWKAQRFCSKACAKTKDSELNETKTESHIRDVAVDTMALSDFDKTICKMQIDEKKCCANCAIFDTDHCTLSHAQSVSKHFDMFEHVCQKFKRYE
jgi:hypothetical protein